MCCFIKENMLVPTICNLYCTLFSFDNNKQHKKKNIKSPNRIKDNQP